MTQSGPTEQQKKRVFFVVLALAYVLIAAALLTESQGTTAGRVMMSLSAGAFVTSLFMNTEHWFVGKGTFIGHIFVFCGAYVFTFA